MHGNVAGCSGPSTAPLRKPTNDAPPQRSIMKKLIAVLTIVTLIAAPTFVQSVSAATVSPSSSAFGGNGY